MAVELLDSLQTLVLFQTWALFQTMMSLQTLVLTSDFSVIPDFDVTSYHYGSNSILIWTSLEIEDKMVVIFLMYKRFFSCHIPRLQVGWRPRPTRGTKTMLHHTGRVTSLRRTPAQYRCWLARIWSIVRMNEQERGSENGCHAPVCRIGARVCYPPWRRAPRAPPPDASSWRSRLVFPGWKMEVSLKIAKVSFTPLCFLFYSLFPNEKIHKSSCIDKFIQSA